MNDALAEQFAAKIEQNFGVAVGEDALARFDRYYHFLLEWNERMNLTAITERESVYWKHFYDSASLLTVSEFDSRADLLDVGSGAGFPSIPLHLLHQELTVTILDSLQKRITFLNELGKELKLMRFSAVHGRAEDFGQQANWRESFSQVTARAVARLPVLLEFCLPFVKPGGYFFAMKGPEGANELEESSKALSLLGGEIKALHSFEIPEIEGSRTIVVIKKVKATPKSYPRKAGTPVRKPIL